MKKPKAKISASEYAEWLFYDDEEILDKISEYFVNGIEPLNERITCTDQWQKGCCCNPDNIKNKEELKDYLIFDDDGYIVDEAPFKENLEIEWV